MPPQKWLVQQKMQLAAGLLKHPDERSGSVFEKVGYDSQSSFTKAFRLQYGITGAPLLSFIDLFGRWENRHIRPPHPPIL